MQLDLTRISSAALLAAALGFAVGCAPDDVGDSGAAGNQDTSSEGGDTSTDGDGGDGDGGAADALGGLEGSWISEGADVSELLAYYGYASVTAVFDAEGGYTIVATHGSGATDSYEGSVAVDLDSDPHGVVATQSVPEAVTSEGIFTVESSTLTWEVVQTTPDAGCTAPTAASGFGSTTCSGQTGDYNVQTFQKQ